VIYSHPYAFCALSFGFGVLSGCFSLIALREATPLDRVDEILRRIEDEADSLRQAVEGNRMQTSSTGDQILHEVRELKELIRNRFFNHRRTP